MIFLLLVLMCQGCRTAAYKYRISTDQVGLVYTWFSVDKVEGWDGHVLYLTITDDEAKQFEKKSNLTNLTTLQRIKATEARLRKKIINFRQVTFYTCH